MNGSVLLAAKLIFAVVSRGRNHYQAGISQLSDSDAKGIVLVRADCRRSDTQIHYANVVGDAVGVNPIERGDDFGC